jgi:subtilase family serine protease
MFQTRRIYAISSFAILLLTGSFVFLRSQTASRALIHDQVDEGKLVTLGGNTRPEVATATDLGAVADDFPLNHMMLQLKRSQQQEVEVERFVANLQDPKSSEYHKWLTAAEFGRRFGAAESDIRAITLWLRSSGFNVNSVSEGRMVIDFSGTAGQVLAAFHTSIHRLDVAGVRHIANVTDPQIPEALAPAIAGVVSLHDFRPHPMGRAAIKRGPRYTINSGGQTAQAVVPADLAAIYDFNPLFMNAITGKGQTIAVVEDTDLFATSDWTTFRSAFGLSQYTSGSIVASNPGGCSDPGVQVPNDAEAILDAEWATAAAPGATIDVAACADTNVSSGDYLATLGLVNSTTPPAVVSDSYGACEAISGAASNAAFNSVFQQAVTEGISVFVAAGDEGAAGCDNNAIIALHGISVNGSASTPYNVAVGGTDFSDTFAGTTSRYWSSANSATYGSALSYIPEIPWNDSCASALQASFNGFSTTDGASGFCASSAAGTGGFLTDGAGSGGPSACATGVPSIFSVVSGTCKGWAKPSWQTGVSGIPADGVRDLPDVSMFASDGSWGHFYIMCFTDTSNTSIPGAPCTGAPSNWTGVGGTSASAPVMAGVQALINQSIGAKQGNPNPIYYSLAAKVPGVFHPTTQGDNDVNCAAPYNCYGYVGTLDYGRGGRVFGTTYGGVLSTSNTSLAPAYAAGAAWNFATGLGSVDVNNLVANWPK